MADNIIITIKDNFWGEATVKDYKVQQASSPEFKATLQAALDLNTKTGIEEGYIPEMHKLILDKLRALYDIVEATGIPELDYQEDVVY